MASQNKYVTEDDGRSEADRPLKVCAEAGRKCVKSIQHYPVLSQEWIALVDSLRQLTRLVHLEGRMPGDSKVADVQGRDQQGVGTLWDQEAHETAIRILVEEAKVNLCLRIMDDFKDWQYDEAQKQSTIQETERSFGYSRALLEQKIFDFEDALGLLLARALTHVETLQLMDVRLLIEYIAKVLNHSIFLSHQSTLQSDPAARGTKLQETIVLSYFRSLMKHSEALNNSELLAKSRELNLQNLVTVQALRYVDDYDMDTMRAVAEGFSALADNEDFISDWEAFFPAEDRESKENFLKLEEKIVNPVLSVHQDRSVTQAKLRPLTDFFNRLRRSLR